MPDDQNTIQNQGSEENSILASHKEPMADIPVSALDPTPIDMPPEVPESSKNVDIPVSLNNDNPDNTPILTENPEEPIPLEPTDMRANPASNGTSEPSVEPVSEPRTAQIPVIEPLPVITSTKLSQKDLWKRFLDKVQIGKRKKLEKIMTLFLKKSKITNDEVEKFLHVSELEINEILARVSALFDKYMRGYYINIMKKYTSFLFVFLFITLLSFDVGIVSAFDTEDSGCLVGDMFSRTTGEVCGMPTFTECRPGDLFNSTTGKPCGVITPTPIITPISCPQFNVGAKGESVKTFQTKLNTLGAILKVDGFYGPKTRVATERYCKTLIPTTPPVVNETANWKTYKSDTYNFEVKYPSDWTSKGSWSEDGGFYYVAFGTSNSIDSKPLATLRVYPNQTTLDEFIKYFDYISGTWNNTTLGGSPTKEVVSIGQNSQQFILTASVKNSYGYQLASTVFGNNVDIVRKMNLTFKFIK